MNQQFAEIFTARLVALTKDLRFDYKPAPDNKRAPQIVETMLPPRATGYLEGQEFPLIRWSIFRGGFEKMRPAPFSVILHGGIYTAGNIVAGTRDITALTMALGKIVDNRSFPPYRLETPISFTIGSGEKDHEGLQPHPYYWVTMQLQFLMP